MSLKKKIIQCPVCKNNMQLINTAETDECKQFFDGLYSPCGSFYDKMSYYSTLPYQFAETYVCPICHGVLTMNINKI